MTALRSWSTSLTVTVQVSVTLGSRTEAALMVQVPAPTALTTPFSTLATVSSELVQVQSRFTTVHGFAETSSVALLPLMRSRLFWLSEIS